MGRLRYNICGIQWCGTRTGGGIHDESYTLHGFPKDPELFSKWLELTDFPPDTVQKTFYKRICSSHFEPSDFQLRPGANFRLLKPNCLPKNSRYPMCSFRGCTNQNEPNSPFKFFKFPHVYDLREQWIASMNRPGFNPKTESVVCSAHFSARCYENGNLRLLAVPDIPLLVIPAIDLFYGAQGKFETTVSQSLLIDPLYTESISVQPVSNGSCQRLVTLTPNFQVSTAPLLEQAIQIQRSQNISPKRIIEPYGASGEEITHSVPSIKQEVKQEEEECEVNGIKIEPSDEFNGVSNENDSLGITTHGPHSAALTIGAVPVLPGGTTKFLYLETPPEFGNVSSECEAVAFEAPQTAVKRGTASPALVALRKSRKVLKQKIRRQDRTIKRLKALVLELKKQIGLSETEKRGRKSAQKMDIDKDMEIG